MKRRLAAIMSADVAGYSRLMAADETGTLGRLKALRGDIIDPLIARHSGRIVKLMGAGALVEFASVVDAVSCAMEIQNAVAADQAAAPDHERLELRIGINLGDIIVDGDDIYGDGVNVAARIEALATPGGICISRAARDQVRDKLDVELEDMGEIEVKNMPRPVRVFRVSVGHNTGGPGASKPPPIMPEKPSIAVLPFVNMSGDPEQEYFADGIAEDLITALSKIRWFFVIARNSTFTYKGQAVDVTRVAEELGVRYVLEGSVRKAGNRVRITAQLIDATTGAHVWAQRYDRELTDIFALQDEMTQTIVAVVEPELGAAERERARHAPPENLDAWETYQRGLWHMWTFTKEGVAEAQSLLRRARELDPGFAAAHAYEGYSHYINVIVGFSESQDDSVAAGLAAAKKAVALDERDSVGYFALVRNLMVRGEHDASIAALEKSLAINPNFAQAHHGLGFALALSGRLDEAATSLEMAERLSPRDPLMWGFKAVHSLICVLLHQDEKAVELARETMREPRSIGFWPHAVLASALGNLGRIDEARAALDDALREKPDTSLAFLKKLMPTKPPDGLEPFLDGLRKAGLEA
jgi:adenylate cyclase